MAAMYSWEGWVLHKEGEKRELKFHLGFTKVLSREKGRRVLRPHTIQTRKAVVKCLT